MTAGMSSVSAEPPDEGTRLSVLFAPSGEDPPGEATASPAEAGARGEATILLAEDDENVRKLTAAALMSNGYRVVQAGDGRAAIEAAAAFAEPIDLLLTDLVMPVMGGFDVARELRRTRPESRILMMSGYTADADDVEIAEIADGFIAKPFTPRQLVAAIAALLSPGG